MTSCEEARFYLARCGVSTLDGNRDGDLLVMDRAAPPLAGNVVLAVVEGVSVLARLGRDARGRLTVRAAGTGLGRPLDDAIAIAGVARWAIRRRWPGRLCP